MSECHCSWSPVTGWIVCEECCNADVQCTHITEELTEQ